MSVTCSCGVLASRNLECYRIWNSDCRDHGVNSEWYAREGRKLMPHEKLNQAQKEAFEARELLREKGI